MSIQTVRTKSLFAWSNKLNEYNQPFHWFLNRRGGLCVHWLILLLVPKQRYNPKLPSQPPGHPQINPFEHS